MSFILRLAACLWFVLGLMGSFSAGPPYDYAWWVAMVMIVVAPMLVMFWVASMVASAGRVNEMEKALRRAKGEEA